MKTPIEAPIWCYNKLTISAVADTFIASVFDLSNQLVDEDDKSPLSFYNHSPIPQMLADSHYTLTEQEVSDNYVKTGYHSMLEFTCEEWGCPYDARAVNAIWYTDDTLHFEFVTVGTPPIAWLKSLSADFPELMFEIESNNEMDLWEAFEAIYLEGKEVAHTIL
jgi:hypothetical protein